MEGNTNFGVDTDPSIDPRRSWMVAAWLVREAVQGETPTRKPAGCHVFAVDRGKKPPTGWIIERPRLHCADPFRVPQEVRVGESTAVIPGIRACVRRHLFPPSNVKVKLSRLRFQLGF